MKRILGVFLFIFFMSINSFAFAAPTFNASTGSINTPSADVMTKDQISIGFYNLHGSRNVGIAIVGLTSKIELGFRRNVYSHSNDNTFSVKYAMKKENITKPGLAIGFEQGTGDDGDSFYVVASKRLIWGIRMHTGIGNNKYRKGFVSLEKSINNVKFSKKGVSNLILEYDGTHLNYGIRASVNEKLKFDLGVKKNRGYFGVSYTKL